MHDFCERRLAIWIAMYSCSVINLSSSLARWSRYKSYECKEITWFNITALATHAASIVFVSLRLKFISNMFAPASLEYSLCLH